MSDKKRNSKLAVYFPLMLAVTLIAGIVIGTYFTDGSGSGETRFLPLPAYSKTNKIGQILQYVEEEYVDSVKKQQLVDNAIGAILEELDPHSYYISPEDLAAYTEPLEGNFDGIGVEFMIVEDTVRVVSPIEGGPSEQLGIQPGDKIVSVEGKNIAGTGITNREVIELLRGERGTRVNIKVKRSKQNELIPYTIERGEIPLHSVTTAQMTQDKVGYLKISRFARTTYKEFEQGIDKLMDKGMQGMVLDLRGNGGGYLEAAIKVTEEFLNKGQLIVYTEGKSQPRRSYEASRTGRLNEMPVVVLINEGSASASEILAGALQDNDRGVIVGRRSFGKGLVQEQMALSDKSALRLTVARYYTPTGRSIQKPYGEGVDYEHEYFSRVESGELLSEDSIDVNDSLKFTTPGGKTVFGGGGIVPDVFVPLDTVGTSDYLSKLNNSGAINSYSFEYANAHRSGLKGEYSGYPEFATGFKIDDEIISDFVSKAENMGVAPDSKGFKGSRNIIEMRLKAGIARNIWGNDAFYHIYLKEDNTFEEAIRILKSGTDLKG